MTVIGTSQTVQWLTLHLLMQVPKTQNIKQKQYCNKFNKDFKNGPHQKIIKIKKTFVKKWRVNWKVRKEGIEKEFQYFEQQIECCGLR